jgi:quinol monooxygenase YgiN
MITVIATIFAAKGKEALIRDVLQRLIPTTREEDGCIEYDLYEDVDVAGEFTFFEKWTSREALDSHLKTEHFLLAGKEQIGHIAKPTEIKVLNYIG